MALSLGFDAFVFALAVPVSLSRPLFRLYGLPPTVQDNGYDAILRATGGTLHGSSWSHPGRLPWLESYAHGWTQPTRGRGTELGVASFLRSTPMDEEEITAKELKMIHLAMTLHHQVMQIITDRGDLYEPLIAEELAVLRWAAQGKTGEEIARIMGVGERRVVHRLQVVREKLRASSTIQAAVRAQGYGLL